MLVKTALYWSRKPPVADTKTVYGKLELDLQCSLLLSFLVLDAIPTHYSPERRP